MQAPGAPPSERVGAWQRCKSRSSGLFYWFNTETKQSVWEDNTLPDGWAWGKDSETGPTWYINLRTGARKGHKPAAVLPGVPPPAGAAPGFAKPGAPAADGTALALNAALTAGDDLLSPAYIPDERPEVRGANVPAKIASKRDYLFSSVPAELRWRLQVDDVALYSITEARLAETQSVLIEDKCAVSVPSAVPPRRKSPKELLVVDATACVGGNTLSFARHFGFVHGVELSEQRAGMLAHNATVCGLAGKVAVHNASFLDLFVRGSRLSQALLPSLHTSSGTASVPPPSSSPLDVVFFDPPWGGPEYKNAVSLDMFLGTTDVSHIIAALLTPFPFLGSAHPSLSRYVVLKAPTNYNVDGLKAVLKRSNPGIAVVAQVEQWKMLLLVIRAADAIVAPAATAAATAGGDNDLLQQLLAAAPPPPHPSASSSAVAGVKRPNSDRGGEDVSSAPPAKRRQIDDGDDDDGPHSTSEGTHLRLGLRLLAQESWSDGSVLLFPTEQFLGPDWSSLTSSASASSFSLPPLLDLSLVPAGGTGVGEGITWSASAQAGRSFRFLPHASRGSGSLAMCAVGLVDAATGKTLMQTGASLHWEAPSSSSSPSSSAAWQPALFCPVLPATVLESSLLQDEAAPVDSLGSGALSEAVAASFGVPLYRKAGVAGKGRRAGEVFEAVPIASQAVVPAAGKLVLKRQPFDARTAQEVQVSMRLLAAAPAAGAHPLVALPLFVVEAYSGSPSASSPTFSYACYPHVGKSLEGAVPPSTRVRLTPKQALVLLRRLLEALELVHASGYLYVDLHPGNVLINDADEPSTAYSRACLIDVGSAQKLTDGGAGKLVYRGPTRGGVWDSMAPEQFASGKWANEGGVTLSPSSDLFAAACLILHLLVGVCAPFNPAVMPNSSTSEPPSFAGFFQRLREHSVMAPSKLTVEGTRGHPLRASRSLLDAYIRGAIEFASEGAAAGGGVEAASSSKEKEALYLALSKALAANPDDRWPTAKAMAQALNI